MLRELADKHPDIMKTDNSKVYSVVQASILAAQEWAKEADFNLAEEVKMRRKAAIEKCLDKLDHDCLQKRGFKMSNGSPVRRSSTRLLRAVVNFDVDKWDRVQACDERVFWEFLKAKGVKYTWSEVPHSCQICTEGPAHELNCQRLILEMADLMSAGHDSSTIQFKELAQAKNSHEAAVELFKIHRKQYELCRPFIAQVQKDLQPQECIVWRDFVNQHGSDGTKAVNLVLVKIWCTEPDGPLHVIKIHNVCTKQEYNKSSAYFVADVFDFHFKSGPGSSTHFKDFTKIYICGDHGSHFACLRTFFHESHMWERYGKLIHCLFLCSYHAYNRCDGAGVQLKRLAARKTREGIGPVHAYQYASFLNSSAHVDSICHIFEKINTPVGLWPDKLFGAGKDLARKYCDVKFGYTDQEVDISCMPGIMLAKIYPGTSEGSQYDVVDLHGPDGGMCQYCSLQSQRPQFHHDSPCPLAQRTVVDRSNIVHPAPERLEVPQVTRQSKRYLAAMATRRLAKRRITSTKPDGSHPCRVPGCNMRWYTTARGCNKHIHDKHSTLSTEEREPYLYNEAARRRKKRKTRTSAMVGSSSADEEAQQEGGECRRSDRPRRKGKQRKLPDGLGDADDPDSEWSPGNGSTELAECKVAPIAYQSKSPTAPGPDAGRYGQSRHNRIMEIHEHTKKFFAEVDQEVTEHKVEGEMAEHAVEGEMAEHAREGEMTELAEGSDVDTNSAIEDQSDQGEEQYQPRDLIAVIHPGTAPWIGWLLERGTEDEWTLKWMEQVRENDHSEWQVNNDYNPDTVRESSFLLTVARADTCLSTAIPVPEDKWERATVLFNQHKGEINGRGG